MRFRKFLKPYKTRGSSFREHTFGVGGVVSRDQESRVLDFNVETDYGILYLSRDSGVLLLDMAGTTEADGVISSVVKPDAIITSVDIENMYKKLRDSSVIQSDKPWFFSCKSYFEGRL